MTMINVQYPLCSQYQPLYRPKTHWLWFVVCLMLYAGVVPSLLAQGNGVVDGLGEGAGLSGESVKGQPVSESIQLENSPADDEQIRQRLYRILSEIEPLSNLAVTVSNSVVQLDGEVESAEARDEAESLAAGIDGVVKVDNNIEVSRDVSVRVRSTWDRLWELAVEVKSLAPVLLLSLLVMAVFWYLASWLSGQTSLWRTVTPNMFIATILGSVVRIVVVVAGMLIALYLMDAAAIISTVLGAAGIVGLALGFAVRDTVENFIASILLSLRQPFQMNDFVQIEQYAGSVARLTGRATILISADGNQVRIPNSIVFKSVITNFTRHPQRRFELTLPVDESENLVRARKVALEAIASVDGVMSMPPPQVHIHSLGEAIVQLQILGWVDQRSHEVVKVHSACAVAVKSLFKQSGIVMPQSVHTLRWVGGNPLESPTQDDKSGSVVEPVGSARPLSPASANEVAQVVATELPTAIDSAERIAVDTQLADEQDNQQNLLQEGNRE